MCTTDTLVSYNEQRRAAAVLVESRCFFLVFPSFSPLALAPTYTNREKRIRENTARAREEERQSGKGGKTEVEKQRNAGPFIKRASNYYCDKRNVRRSTSASFKSPGDALKRQTYEIKEKQRAAASR